MANVSSYIFDNMSRIGNDNCSMDQRSIQNVNTCNYTLQNYFAKDCSMKDPIALATTQPGVNYKGGFQSGAGGCNIDQNSQLLIGSIQTHPKCRIDLFQRPFATVPYLGRGSVDPTIESEIQQGEAITNKRSVTKLGEKSYIDYTNTPLMSDLKERYTNPVYSVEGAASPGWVRGGVPSRELMRDTCNSK
jgi:hypothetical protein